MKYAPIVLFVYNRPYHTRRTLEALSRNELAIESDLFIFADGAKENATSEQLHQIEETRKVIKEKQWCKNVEIIESTKNKGLANSIIDGVTKIVNQYGKIIVLEDDLLTGKYFLNYMNDALDKYENEDRVISIHGFMYEHSENLQETFFIKGADCWGWATWKRGWDLFNPDGNELLKRIKKQKLGKQFDLDGVYDYVKMLKNQIKGKNDSWAIRWHASAFLADKLTLYPSKSLVVNFGFDGSGTHCSELQMKFNEDYENTKIKIDKILIEENQNARNVLKKELRADGFLCRLFEKVLTLMKTIIGCGEK